MPGNSRPLIKGSNSTSVTRNRSASKLIFVVLLRHSLEGCNHGGIPAQGENTLLFVQIAGVVVYVVEGLGKPALWEILACGVAHNLAAAVCGDHRPVWIDHNEAWDARHTEGLREVILRLPVLERQCWPGHLTVVFIKSSLVPVRRHEDDLHLVLQPVLVEFCKLWREAATGRAPMC